MAENLAQDCLFKVHRARASFRGNASLDTWIFAIAGNLLRDYLRNRKLRFWRQVAARKVNLIEIAEQHASSAQTPEQALLSRERIGRVMRALDHLSVKQRKVFLLKFVEDMDNSKIAEVMGMSAGTVKTHLHRALVALKHQIGAQK